MLYCHCTATVLYPRRAVPQGGALLATASEHSERLELWDIAACHGRGRDAGMAHIQPLHPDNEEADPLLYT